MECLEWDGSYANDSCRRFPLQRHLQMRQGSCRHNNYSQWYCYVALRLARGSHDGNGMLISGLALCTTHAYTMYTSV